MYEKVSSFFSNVAENFNQFLSFRRGMGFANCSVGINWIPVSI
jgi:hypothetical protein